MIYFDTSFLTPLFRKEEASSRVAGFMLGLPMGALAISHWTMVEFASVLARDVWTGLINAEQAHAKWMILGDIVGESFLLLSAAGG